MLHASRSPRRFRLRPLLGLVLAFGMTTVAAAVAPVAAAPEQGGPRNWTTSRAVQLREQPSAKGNILARYPAGTILDNLGCRRAEGGDATVVGTRPDGRTRAIFFRMGRPLGADTSQADGYGAFKAAKESDLLHIRVGDERYEIPEAVIFGG